MGNYDYDDDYCDSMIQIIQYVNRYTGWESLHYVNVQLQYGAVGMAMKSEFCVVLQCFILSVVQIACSHYMWSVSFTEELRQSTADRCFIVTYIIEFAYRKQPIDNSEFISVEVSYFCFCLDLMMFGIVFVLNSVSCLVHREFIHFFNQLSYYLYFRYVFVRLMMKHSA